MSSQEIIKKYRGHLKHLNQAYYGLNARYALLEPMYINANLIARNNNKGFNILRQSLLFDCVLNIVNITYKTREERVPSIELIGEKILNNQNIIEQLHKELLGHESIEGTDWENYHSEGFWSNVEECKKLLPNLLSSDTIKAFKTLRDKRIAHLEVKLNNGNYELLDITTLGLKWADIGEAIQTIESALKLLNLVVALTGWDVGESLNKINDKMKKKFFQSAFNFQLDSHSKHINV